MACRDNAALQAYFTGRVQKLVAGHHKIMEGWDEVLQPDTPRDVVIQSWRGQSRWLRPRGKEIAVFFRPVTTST